MDKHKKKIVIHNDFNNLLAAMKVESSANSANLAKIASQELLSKADIISLVAATPEMCNYSPTLKGEICGSAEEENPHSVARMRRVLIEDGVDPFGVVLGELRGHGCTVLASLRVNDCHHVAGMPWRASQFWKQHPQWQIGNVESKHGGEASFNSYSCISPLERDYLLQRRPFLLDYAIPEVREHRLKIVEEFMQRYDVDGLTLNFLREPYCVSFPSQNAPLLTDFLIQCRKIVDQAVGKRGKAAPIMGAILPWDINYCRVMGLDVETWIKDGLLDYVSPTDTWVTGFNTNIEPWADLASGTRCAVYPGIVGLTSYENDVCIPEEYELERGRETCSTVTRENIRALGQNFYAEGADGISFFNFYTAQYNHLFPLPDICLPEQIKNKQRRFIYLKQGALFSGWDFLQLVFSPGVSTRQIIKCRLHENLKQVTAYVRFKARHLDDTASLCVDVNSREIPAKGLSLIPHDGKGFLYVQFQITDGMLCDGINEIGFAFRDEYPATDKIIIQEVEIRIT